jgi:hypothetical protein
VSKIDTTYSGRLLPTYRWDDWDTRNPEPHQLSKLEDKLLASTSKVLHNFIQEAEEIGDHVLPPESVISPILTMNVAKRSSATRNAEVLIHKGEITTPPASLIPTFMNSGHTIPGVQDRYMLNDHPSQELFAYNRLHKKSWLNRRFGEHCLKAIGFAHPNGIVESSKHDTRVKAHASPYALDTSADGWVIVSTKSTIASVYENDRRASLISRVTGAVDITSPTIGREEADAILELAQCDKIYENAASAASVIAQKALLLEALNRNDDTENNAFHPVIQTVYLTQQSQK